MHCAASRACRSMLTMPLQTPSPGGVHCPPQRASELALRPQVRPESMPVVVSSILHFSDLSRRQRLQIAFIDAIRATVYLPAKQAGRRAASQPGCEPVIGVMECERGDYNLLDSARLIIICLSVSLALPNALWCVMHRESPEQ